MSVKLLDEFNCKFPGSSTQRYFNFDTQSFNHLLETKDENFWEKLGEKKALELFHQAAKRVPAYRSFLKKYNIKPESIKTVEDFKTVPLTDKRNYINSFSIEERSWDGKLSTSKLLAVSSGTGGKPNFWTRGDYQEFEAAVVHELIYKNSFQVDKLKTLLLVGFPMGVYVSGIATVIPSWMIALKGYPITVASVGNSKAEMLRIVEQLGDQYDQIVLVGHPFFIKDVLETGKANGVKWPKYNVRLMFCSEGFSETWREYIREIIGAKKTDDVISVYGCSEMLLMGYETELSIKVRRLFSKDLKLAKRTFSTSVVPNLFQYNPFLRYIESVNKELVFTSYSGMPLIRYNMHDQGIVIPKSVLSKSSDGWQLPFIALWGRSDQTLVFYAANIYPENIQTAIQKTQLIKKLTGKFVMRKGELKNLDEYLEINVELNNNVHTSKDLQKAIQKTITAQLSEENMEYHFLQENLEKDLVPRINLWPYQSEKYFKPGLKPRYIFR